MLDDEWNNFLLNQDTNQGDFINNNSDLNKSLQEPLETSSITNSNVPECEDLYISTTTKVLFLNQPIDIQSIYWKIPIIDYWKPEEGVIKKQIKIVSNQHRLLSSPFFSKCIRLLGIMILHLSAKYSI